MQALRTTYHPPTATKGPRITAADAYGSKCTVPLEYPEAGNYEDEHRKAAEALCNKLGFQGTLYGGELRDGMAWVLVPADEPKAPAELTRPSA